MDEMVREDKFKKYLNRLDQAKGEPGVDQKSHFLSEKLDSFSEILNDNQDINEFHMAKGILTAAILLILTFGYIKFGYTYRYLPALILIMAFAIYYRITMAAVHDKNKHHESAKDAAGNDRSKVLSRIKYLISTADVKLGCLNIVRIYYTVMFPVFLFYLRDVLADPSESLLPKIILAILFGSAFWWFYFKTPKDELEIVKMDLKEVENQFLTQAD